jgi:hypothetical protein
MSSITKKRLRERLIFTTITDGLVIFACLAIILGLFGKEAVKAVDRTDRIEAFYDQLSVKSDLHKAFIGAYRLCSPALNGRNLTGPGNDCMSNTIRALKPIGASAERLFEVEQDVRDGEQAIYAQTTTTFLR